MHYQYNSLYEQPPSDTIVIQLGSSNIKINYSSAVRPHIIPNVIAHKRPQSSEFSLPKAQNIPFNPSPSFIKEISSTMNDLSDFIQITQESKTNNYVINKHIIKFDQVQEQHVMNPNDSVLSRINKYDQFSVKAIRNPDKKVYIGQDALNIIDTQNKYIHHFPIKFGQFNLKSQTAKMVVSNLEKIIVHGIQETLKLTKEQLQQFNVVISVPNTMNRSEIIDLIDLFLRNIRFKSLLMHREAVLAGFGMQSITSCVVDIGATKTSVICIEEGEILEKTILQKYYGSDDINCILGQAFNIEPSAKQMPSPWFPFASNVFLQKNLIHNQLLEQFKINACGYYLSERVDQLIRVGLFRIPVQSQKGQDDFDVEKGTQQLRVLFNYCALTIIGPFAYFLPKLVKHSCVHQYKKMEEVSKKEILANNFYLNDPNQFHCGDLVSEIQKDVIREKQQQEKKRQQKSVHDLNHQQDQNLVLPSHNSNIISINTSSIDNAMVNQNPVLVGLSNLSAITKENQFSDLLQKQLTNQRSKFQFEPLDDLICKSICSIRDKDLRKKLANNILIIGGGAKFDGLTQILEDRLIDCIQKYDEQIERIEIITPAALMSQMKKIPTGEDAQGIMKKEVANRFNFDPGTISWAGGSIMTKLEYAKELFISREKWTCQDQRIVIQTKGEVSSKLYCDNEGGFAGFKEKVLFQI